MEDYKTEITSHYLNRKCDLVYTKYLLEKSFESRVASKGRLLLQYYLLRIHNDFLYNSNYQLNESILSSQTALMLEIENRSIETLDIVQFKIRDDRLIITILLFVLFLLLSFSVVYIYQLGSYKFLYCLLFVLVISLISYRIQTNIYRKKIHEKVDEYVDLNKKVLHSWLHTSKSSYLNALEQTKKQKPGVD